MNSNIIKITTDNKISAVSFPEGTHAEQNRKLREYIGPKCSTYEHVMPKRLYQELGGSNKPRNAKGECVSMLIDEDGYYKNLPVNKVGSWLYGTDMHGHPILGDILIVGEYWNRGGIDFCGISEQQFNILYSKLEKLTEEVKVL